MSPEALRETALQAREVTLDFARKGAKTTLLSRAIPFFNAAIQGADKFAREARHNPKMWAKGIATVTIPTLSLYLINRKNKKWQELPDYEKNNYWHIYIPYPGGDLHFKIAKPFEIGAIFANIPERIVEYADTKNPDNIKQIFESLWDVFTPGLVPAIAQAPVETFANKKIFSGAPLIPQRLQYLPPEEQYQPYTTESAKLLGKIISKIPFIGKGKAASPIVLEHWINSYTAGVGNTLLKTTENLLRKIKILPAKVEPEKELADYPVLKTFFGRKGYTTQANSIREFYNRLNEMKGYHRAYNLAKREKRKQDAAKIKSKYDLEELKKAQEIQKVFAKNFATIRNITNDPEHYTPKDKKILIDQLIEDMVNASRKYLGKD